MTTRFQLLTRLCLLLLFTASLIGCNNQSAQNDSGETSDLPKQSFHKPKTYEAAMSRLREIEQILTSEDPIPEPKTFQVVEIQHGEGAGAHSHYHLADTDYKAEMGHSEEDEKEKMHEYKVDIFTELEDISRWLPSIAGNGDMGADNWRTVKSESEELSEALQKALRSKESDEDKRSAFQEVHETFTAAMKVLQSCSKVDQIESTDNTTNE